MGIKFFNVRLLSKELKAAGITTHGNCSDSGIVWDDDNNEIQDRPDVQAVLQAHNPNGIISDTPSFNERLEAAELILNWLVDR